MARTTVWRGRTPGGLPLSVEHEDGARWSVTVADAVRCRDRSLSNALSTAVGLSPTSLWVRHAASVVLGQKATGRTATVSPCGNESSSAS